MVKIFEPVPDDVDFIFFIQFSILMAIAILMMFYSDGVVTLRYINSLDLSVSDSVSTNSSFIVFYDSRYSSVGYVMDLEKNLSKQNYYIPYVIQFLYWIVSPFFNFLYFFFSPRRTKHLNTCDSVINRGVS